MVDLCIIKINHFYLKPELMKNVVFIFTIYILLHNNVIAQDVASVNRPSYDKPFSEVTGKMASFDFEVYNFIPEELKKVTIEMAGTHFLGDEIAKKIYLFEDAYTYKVAIAPGNPATRTMFRKQTMYNSVRKIEKFLKKSLKNHTFTLDEAMVKFNKVLDVAITTKGVNTQKFEDTIKSNNNSQDLLALFTQVRLNYTN